MDLSYLITPFFAWLVTGGVKFVVNTIKEKRLAFDLVGYGGMPSNHSSIVSSAVAIIAFNEGFQEPALVVALALAFIVMLDANSLRQQIGKHAKAINKLNSCNDVQQLRERMGHTRFEILAGIISGISSASIVHYFFTTIA
ncbi:divergent PAP2 family protein [Vibrio diazotrophicus]|uniref:divergent PAP2 family protein n=1 Tax=Vibrio diazotrophicus TaxID=685 RepID=UPI0022AFFAE0|nr:divergent PAP2 family protein [Vibrio diazotrophicus]MCZ4372668.1 divergent PAP2 family protein [Vibrio diazotrophicus]